MGEGGLGGKGRGVLWNYYNIYLHIYSIYIFTVLYGGRFERCRSVALYLVVFIMVSVSTNIYLGFFCACLLSLLGEGHVVSGHSVSSCRLLCIHFMCRFINIRR